jgi:hypothetical protein
VSLSWPHRRAAKGRIEEHLGWSVEVCQAPAQSTRGMATGDDLDDLSTVWFEWVRLPAQPLIFRAPLPRRWVAKRTIGRLSQSRRVSLQRFAMTLTHASHSFSRTPVRLFGISVSASLMPSGSTSPKSAVVLVHCPRLQPRLPTLLRASGQDGDNVEGPGGDSFLSTRCFGDSGGVRSTVKPLWSTSGCAPADAGYRMD